VTNEILSIVLFVNTRFLLSLEQYFKVLESLLKILAGGTEAGSAGEQLAEG